MTDAGHLKSAPSADTANPVHKSSGGDLSPRTNASIIPQHTIASRALIAVIMIMTFLASLTVGTTSIISKTASGWQSDISREVTIQVRPSDTTEMDKAVREASRIALSYDGVVKVTVLDDEAVTRLLEPWLGVGLELNELPMPRLLTVSLNADRRPDFASMRQELEQSVPGVTLDDHRAWVELLTNMAWTMVMLGLAIFVLVMGATILIVVFTTRGAMVENSEIIDVLHFVGADSAFIAGQFQRHFLRLGLLGAAVGGALAMLLFTGLGFWLHQSVATPQGDQINALFGSFNIGVNGYTGIAIVMIIVAVLTASTSRMTVNRHVWNLENVQSNGGN